jgi:hypothetical protein
MMRTLKKSNRMKVLRSKKVNNRRILLVRTIATSLFTLSMRSRKED